MQTNIASQTNTEPEQLKEVDDKTNHLASSAPVHSPEPMKDQITIAGETFAVSKHELTQGHLDQREVAYLSHKRASNWVATVHFDPTAPNCLARTFWQRGSGSYVAVPASLSPGDVLEFGADYYTGGGYRQERRQYRRVLCVTEDALIVRATGKPGKRPLPPVLNDIVAAALNSDTAPIVNPLAEISTEALLSELTRRGQTLPVSDAGNGDIPENITNS